MFSIVFSIFRLKSVLRTDIVAANIPLIFVIIKIYIKNITSKGFIRSNYKEKLVDLSDVRINLKSQKSD